MLYSAPVIVENIIKDSEKDKKENVINKIDLSNTLFKLIDRNKEDKLVNKYQKTQSKKALEKLYEIRKQTLQIWSRKYSYLRASEEDLLSDISIVWLKCINQYEYKPKKRKVRNKKGKFIFKKNGKIKTILKRTPFNTFLYTSLIHYISNINKRQHGQKRVDKDGRPHESHLISIDYEYNNNNNNNSQKVCLKDTLVSQSPGPASKYITDSMIEDISKGDSEVKDALVRFTSDSHIKKISNACQNISEKITVCRKDAKIFRGHKGTAKKRLKQIINESNKYSKGYRLLNFRFDDKNKTVSFDVKRKDTAVLRKTIKALEKYKEKMEMETVG